MGSVINCRSIFFWFLVRFRRRNIHTWNTVENFMQKVEVTPKCSHVKGWFLGFFVMILYGAGWLGITLNFRHRHRFIYKLNQSYHWSMNVKWHVDVKQIQTHGNHNTYSYSCIHSKSCTYQFFDSILSHASTWIPYKDRSQSAWCVLRDRLRYCRVWCLCKNEVQINILVIFATVGCIWFITDEWSPFYEHFRPHTSAQLYKI